MKFAGIFFFVVLMVFNIMLIEKFQEIYLLLLLIIGMIGVIILGIVQEIAKNTNNENKNKEIRSKIIKNHFN